MTHGAGMTGGKGGRLTNSIWFAEIENLPSVEKWRNFESGISESS